MTGRVRCAATKSEGKPPKLRFDTFESAVAAAVRRSRAAGALRVYECQHCAGWHLTSKVRIAGTAL